MKFGGSFISKQFKRRYRNSLRIQQLSKFLALNSNNCWKDEEEQIPFYQGEKPLWIDTANNDQIVQAIVKLKKYTTKYPKNQIILLFDDTLDDGVLGKT